MTRVPAPSAVALESLGFSHRDAVPLDVVRAFFGSVPPVLRPLGGGFSDAVVALLGEPGSGDAWVIKRFATGTGRRRAECVHAVTALARSAGIDAVPEARRAVRHGAPPSTIVSDGLGGLWEASAWKPGRSVAVPSVAQAGAAGVLLAAVHAALERCTQVDERPVATAIRPGQQVVSPGLQERLSRVRSLSSEVWSKRIAQVRPRQPPDRGADDVASLILHTALEVERTCGGVRARLSSFVPPDLPVQWVLRDARSEHMLFVGERVGGLVDWHAAGIDSPLCDLSRLLGDWAVASGGCERAHERPWWCACLDAYGGLDERRRELVRLMHEAGLFGALDNWFRWVIEERRGFADWAAVASRVSAIGRCLVGIA